MNATLASIHIHPIKSLGGFGADEARLTDRGLEHDRRWMLVDTHDRFVTQRDIPAMACLHCTPLADGFRVTDIRDGSFIDMAWELSTGENRRAVVWDDPVEVIVAGADLRNWFTHHLGVTVTPVFMPAASERPTDARYAKAINSFSDGFPYLILSQRSLDALNDRLPVSERVPMDRFRPNLVIAGGEAFQEDRWRTVKIGDVPFHLVKPCARCMIITTDQLTGVRGKEPLATLARFRRREDDPSKVDFGMNAVSNMEGRVRRGDTVRVLSKAN